MTLAIWTAINDDFSDTGNWTGGSGTGGSPTTGDDILFPGTSSQSVLSGLNQSALHFNNVFIHPNFGGRIGDVGNPLRCTWGGEFRHMGSQPVHFQADSAGASTCNDLYIASANTDGAFFLYGDTDISIIMATAGAWNITGGYSGQITHLVQGQAGKVSQDVRGIIQAGVSNSPSWLHINGGIFETHIGLSLAYLHAGDTLVHASSGTFANLDVAPNARCYYNGGGNITALRNGGVMDLRRNQNAITITTLYRLGGGVIHYDPTLVTITNDFGAVSP